MQRGLSTDSAFGMGEAIFFSLPSAVLRGHSQQLGWLHLELGDSLN